MIRSSKVITIGSSNHKKNSVDTSLVYSMTKLGQEYYVFIPLAWGYPKEVAVFGLQDSTSVTVELKCAVTFEGFVNCKQSSCKAGEECKVVGGVSECVATTSPARGNSVQVNVCPDNNPDCDCVYQGKVMKHGEAWMSADCSEKCVCLTGGWVQCEIPGCRPGGSCVEKGGVWLCSTPEPSCYLLPSGGFKSFDGLEDWVWTEGTYSLAVPAPSTQDAFRIIAHLNPFGDTVEPTVIFPSKFGEDFKVEVKKDFTTVVNGKAVSLPFRTNNGLEIVGSENTVVVQHTSGLNLRYCCHGKVTVTLTAAFRGKMTGLCGNFNGRADDDLQLRDGSVADNIEDFYADWMI
ncbi:hypothetical protein SKAU_G00418000 [Synaphobranchus kaupii]|uniref:VWFD domain-containing protein n=1 Tax=Synaphobranchus kaupii TaxID=118154 RepID=A0A9Q1E628_SYNKA|nr:hypothetical protein SKAU_G00418000 [Synaphobranchus kaupii]